LCSTKILISDPRKPEHELPTSKNMSSFNDIGGEDGGDTCNNFDFDEDNRRPRAGEVAH
jgi:hypothetical protein